MCARSHKAMWAPQAAKETKTHIYTFNESSWVTDTLMLRWDVLCAVNSTQRGGGRNKNQCILREIPALKWVTHLNCSKITDIKEWPRIHKVPPGFFFFWDILCWTPLCLRGLRLTVSVHEAFPKKVALQATTPSKNRALHSCSIPIYCNPFILYHMIITPKIPPVNMSMHSDSDVHSEVEP